MKANRHENDIPIIISTLNVQKSNEVNHILGLFLSDADRESISVCLDKVEELSNSILRTNSFRYLSNPQFSEAIFFQQGRSSASLFI